MIQKILILIPLELSLILLASFGFVVAFREKEDKAFRIFLIMSGIFCVITGITTAIGIIGV